MNGLPNLTAGTSPWLPSLVAGCWPGKQTYALKTMQGRAEGGAPFKGFCCFTTTESQHARGPPEGRHTVLARRQQPSMTGLRPAWISSWANSAGVIPRHETTYSRYGQIGPSRYRRGYGGRKFILNLPEGNHSWQRQLASAASKVRDYPFPTGGWNSQATRFPESSSIPLSSFCMEGTLIFVHALRDGCPDSSYAECTSGLTISTSFASRRPFLPQLIWSAKCKTKARIVRRPRRPLTPERKTQNRPTNPWTAPWFARPRS
jgi:hypothetical protein